jgi:hypothetical protein
MPIWRTIHNQLHAVVFLEHLIQWNLYLSRIIRFPGSIVQFLWSLSESYFNYGSHIYCFPGSIVYFQTPDENDE